VISATFVDQVSKRLRCNWCRNLAAVNCISHWIVLTQFTLQMGITLVIVVVVA